MNKKILSLFSRKNRRVFALGVACIASSFAIGIQSVGEVQPVTLIEAGAIGYSGDLNGDGSVTVKDAIRILEISQGYAVASPRELMADPNRDGYLTVDDAMRILSELPNL